MKNKLLRIALAAGGTAFCVIIISCVCHGPGSGDKNKIIFEEDRIFIPGNNISPEDQAAMNKILQEFDKSLYRIQTYEGGKNVKTLGALRSKFLPFVVVQKVIENAKMHSLTGSAIQAGRGKGGSQFRSPSPHPESEPIGTKAQLALRITGQKFRYNDKELVRRLRTILEKYNHP